MDDRLMPSCSRITEGTMTNRSPGTHTTHPSPNRIETPRGGMRSAFEIAEARERFGHLSDDDLRRIPILPAGGTLEAGATYLDLKAGRPHEVTALGDMEAGEENWYVPKGRVPAPLWNRLREVPEPRGD
jgi:hypothetical protein